MASPSGLVRQAETQIEITPDLLVRAYRLMYLSRRLDDREIILKQRNQIYFQVSAAGHEAIQAAAGLALRPGHDWFVPYYRDKTLALALGTTPLAALLQAVGAGADKQSGGRQMPNHWSSPELHIVSTSSCTGTQFLHGVGVAHASKLLGACEGPDGEVTLVCAGDGATSEGEFWEALNAACLEKLPLIFLIEDNGYAISTPREAQTPGDSISKLVASHPGLYIREVNGCDFAKSYRTMAETAAHCRAGNGPALVHAHTTRPYGHSLSDDETLYKTPEERQREAERDPIGQFAAYLEAEGICSADELRDIEKSVDTEVHEATEAALAAAPPATGAETKYLFSPTVDPTGPSFASEPRESGQPRTMIDALNQCMHDELGRNEKIVVFGEDVADCSREENLPEVKGKGGVFKATRGLQRAYGEERVFNAPIAEAAIVGRALGMAVRGYKPIVEIQFFDYIWPAMMQIRDELAMLRWRSFNGFSAPIVIRAPIGGYLNGGAVYHSQSGEVMFTHLPGIRVVFPSNSLDAQGLMRTAIRCEDPVLFLEHKKLYRETYNRAPYAGPDFTIPFGKARVVREGADITFITYGALVNRAERAAAALAERRGISVEILDLRSLAPYDWDAIAESVRKTSRAVVAHEDSISFGYGAEIAARIGRELFFDLDAPVGRVGAMDTWVAYHPDLEREILPQTDDLIREAEAVLDS